MGKGPFDDIVCREPEKPLLVAENQERSHRAGFEDIGARLKASSFKCGVGMRTHRIFDRS